MNRRNLWLRALAAGLCLCALLIAPPAGAEEAGQAQRITKKCSFKVSEGNRDKLTDGKVRTIWSYEHKDAYVGIKLPDDAEAGWLRVEWFFDPTGFELIEFDAAMSELQRRDQTCTFPNIYSMYPLLPETKYIQLKMTVKGQRICTMEVYSSGELPSDVQLWNPPVEKADLMVVSTHQDDELIFLGGTIPYYATALQKPTIVVYMTNCSRYRRNEALNALWKMGVRDYPEFINLEDKKVGSMTAGVKLWGGKDNILSLLVERIRRFRPEVIVTQDLNGEYGHNQHKITARAMKYAIDAAADPAQYPDSYARYGEWQVKKLYHHLYKENQIVMDWETPLESLHGYTPLRVAQIGMNEHASQLGAYSVKSHGTYDNSKFGLYFTTVGVDEAKNDFLEHIDPDASAKYLAEHAEENAAREAAYAEAAAGAPTEPPEAEDEAEAPAGEEDAEDVSEGGEGAEAPAEAATDPEGDGEIPDEGISEAEPVPTEAPLVAPGEPLIVPTAAPAPANEGGGSTLLPIAMIALGVAAIGAGGWYGWRAVNARGRRRRRGRR